ncbi:MAG: hypothetical protein HXY25_12450 [Alphaproteobacteria bacterium]|nr:hypothetical protein [Alphaproteobacteria bacterium]
MKPGLALALLLCLAPPSAPALADGRGGGGNGGGGEIVPLSEAAGACRSRYGGRLLDARLENQSTYVIVCETREGRIVRLRVDARTGRVLDVEGRARPGAGTP